MVTNSGTLCRILVLVLVSIVVRSDEEFENGKYSSGQVRSGSAYHHILVGEREGKSGDDEDDNKGVPRERHAWFTSSRGKGCYRLVRTRTRIAKEFVQKSLFTVDRAECEEQCAYATRFTCRGFNFRIRDDPNENANCELSLQDTYGTDVNDELTFNVDSEFDFYERTKLGRDCQGRPLTTSSTDFPSFSTTARPAPPPPSTTTSTRTSTTGVNNNQNNREIWTQQTKPGWSTPSPIPPSGKWPASNFNENTFHDTFVTNHVPTGGQTITNVKTHVKEHVPERGQTITNVNTHINEITHHPKHPFVSKPVMQGSTSNNILGNVLITGQPSLTANIDGTTIINTNIQTDPSVPVTLDNHLITSNTNTISSNAAVITPETSSTVFNANSNTVITRQPFNRNRVSSHDPNFGSTANNRTPFNRNNLITSAIPNNVPPPPQIKFHRVNNPQDNNRNALRNRNPSSIITKNEISSSNRNDESKKNPNLFISPTKQPNSNNRFQSNGFHRVIERPVTSKPAPTGLFQTNRQPDFQRNRQVNNRQFWVTPNRNQDDNVDRYSWITSNDVLPSGQDDFSPFIIKKDRGDNYNQNNFNRVQETSFNQGITSGNRISNSHTNDFSQSANNQVQEEFNQNNLNFNNLQFKRVFSHEFNDIKETAPPRKQPSSIKTNEIHQEDSSTNNYFSNIFNAFNNTFGSSNTNQNNRNENRIEDKIDEKYNVVDTLTDRHSNAVNTFSDSNRHQFDFNRFNPTQSPSNSRPCNDRTTTTTTTTLRPTFLPANANFPNLSFNFPNLSDRTKPISNRIPFNKPNNNNRPNRPVRPARPIRPNQSEQDRYKPVTSRPFRPIRPTRRPFRRPPPTRPPSFTLPTTPRPNRGGNNLFGSVSIITSRPLQTDNHVTNRPSRPVTTRPLRPVTTRPFRPVTTRPFRPITSTPRTRIFTSRPPRPIHPITTRPRRPTRPNTSRPRRPTGPNNRRPLRTTTQRPLSATVSYIHTTPRPNVIDEAPASPSSNNVHTTSKPKYDYIPPNKNTITSNTIHLVDSHRPQTGGSSIHSPITSNNPLSSGQNQPQQVTFQDLFSNHINSNFGASDREKLPASHGFNVGGSPITQGSSMSSFGNSVPNVGIGGGSFGIGITHSSVNAGTGGNYAGRPSSSGGNRPFITGGNRPFTATGTINNAGIRPSNSGINRPIGSGSSQSSFGDSNLFQSSNSGLTNNNLGTHVNAIVEQSTPFRPECFRLGLGDTRLQLGVVRRRLKVYDLKECQRRCFEMTTFTCRSVAFRYRGNSWHGDNCYISDRDILALNPFDTHADNDFDLFSRNFRGRHCGTVSAGAVAGVSTASLTSPSIDLDAGRETVSGLLCYGNSRCREDQIGGYWYCDTNAYGAWDYCCRPDQTCSASSGSRLKWCYVGSLGLDQWRPCDNGFKRDFLLDEDPKNVTSNNDTTEFNKKVGGDGASVLASLTQLDKNYIDNSIDEKNPSYLGGNPPYSGVSSNARMSSNSEGGVAPTNQLRKDQFHVQLHELYPGSSELQRN